MPKIGLQLYSIKERCAEDFFGALEKVAEAGYDGVEFAGYYEKTSTDLYNTLKGIGLQAAGSHISIEQLESNLDQVIEYSHKIESPYIVCPGLPDSYRDNADAYKRTAELFTKIGDKTSEAGIAFGYHNHDIELKKFEGEYGLDLLFRYSDPKAVFMELDTFWLEATGLKSVDWIRKYKERVKLLHMKDMNNAQDLRNVEVGSGIMDFHAIHQTAKAYQVDWYTVEQEEFDKDEFVSIKESATFLQQLLKA
ncbi:MULTISPECIES: sugar phosphate isomerase/epimerase family protein [Shouchella]|uniref:Sugar phosphate isomerase/epimerase n=2 Tax=Shouchella TaxID=2893057 RepID=A0ABY7W0H0_9BACI|nr:MULTISPECIES: sugar phosphate isomerase/epimerase [Shouchella]MED4129356.1 sugar phosphate isomerase/epimerase [Shouchella miscanthi]WDF02453.1 sugar phosphate isomerase/epimerase [Shouchella hunanensis]